MKPAPSIIGFTTASGLGYGMLFVMALGSLTGLLPTDRWLGMSGFALAFAAVTGGLVASTFHLGHPERAWRAISQWRSSWLSREGLLALVTYVPAILFALGWVIGERVAGLTGLMALLTAVLAAATVYCTGMIYASLPPIRTWHQPLTAPLYLAFSAMTGLLAMQWLLTLFGADHVIVGALALAAIAGAFALKILYWQKLRREAGDGPTASDATGLGSAGLVRMLDPPHTQTNYLLEEMGFRIARKHAGRLRMLALAFGLFGSLILTLLTMVFTGWTAVLPATGALLAGVVGVLTERWLFFAEAEHTMMLYYGGHGQADRKDQTAQPVSSGRSPAAGAVRTKRQVPPRPIRQVLLDEDQAAER